MPHLLLLRHAKSDWSDAALADFDRPLAERGRRAAPVIGRFIAQKKWRPDLVLCSSALRTRQTLDLVLPELPVGPQVRFLRSLYLAPLSRMLSLLQRQPAMMGSIMVVAHNPGMEHLAFRLLGGATPPASRKMAEKFPTAALAHFKVSSWSGLGGTPADLKDFVRPKDLA